MRRTGEDTKDQHGRKAVLVTGGAGYVGSHAAKALALAGFLPVTVDDLSRGHRSAVLWGPLVEASLSDGAALEETMRRYDPIAVLHFAALAYVDESVRDPARYYRNNVVHAVNLLDAMRRHGIAHVVFSSTCATYGVPERLPLDESHPSQPINPYGHTKLVVEEMLRAHQRAYGLRWLALRYFNAAGADPDGQLGERHDPETHLIPRALLAASGRGPALPVRGTDFPTADGSAVRDYVHVHDLARAHVDALRYLLDGGASRVLNLGTGSGHSVWEVVAAVERVTGRAVPTVHGTRREGDPPALVADASAARRLLGWTPTYLHLDDIVTTAWRWFRAGIPGGPTARLGSERPGREVR